MSRSNYIGRKPSSVYIKGFKIVNLNENGSRETIRFWNDGSLIAILQKNKNVAIRHSGIFDDENNVSALWNVMRCLHGLKLIGYEDVQKYAELKKQKKDKRDLENLEYDVERLGYKLVKK